MQTSKFKPVRHNSKDPTPFLKKNFERYCSNIPKDHQVADLGCGNMRNTNYLKSLGYYNVWAFDKVPDCGGLEIDLGTELIKFLQKKTHGFSRGMNFVTA